MRTMLQTRRWAWPTLLVLTGSVWAGTAVVSIDANKPGPKINPRMYGIFLEEINHGVDGGLYAELIRNRAFEDSRAPEGYTLRNGRYRDQTQRGFDSGFSRYGYTTEGVPFWSLVQEGGAQGAMHLEATGGVTEASAYCLRLDVNDLAGGRLGVANQGFFGIGIKQGVSYDLSLYARGDVNSLTVRLEDPNGRPCSDEAKIDCAGKDWTQYKATLTGSKTEPKARFAITAGTKGKVWLDFVSLFPGKTWRSRPNGLRPDIAQMIAELRPGFVRFPGGCVVEGGTVETAYNWKLTVGRIEERPERWGPWNYRETHGMGLYEYLQFMEDIGAEPLWVGFAGQTCIFRERENVPMDQMGWVRDNFLDIVEYANGTAQSKWGALRAQAGHATSFGLKYVEIGNENAGPEFGERYRFVYDAMKAKYPDLKYLADLSWTDRESYGNTTWDIEDRHYYQSPRWFMSRFHEYDGRDRKLPPLYLGEVAVTSNDGGPTRGNLLAALAEGVFLMGCERNGDTVSMVSYAPLLGHVEGRTELTNAPPPWHAMIYHDGARVFGTASYYLWKLLGTNVPERTVSTEVTFPDARPVVVAGQIGLGTWASTAEFKDVKVEKAGQVLYASDFAKGTEGWTRGRDRGQWTVADGAYRQGREGQSFVYLGDETWSDYTLTLKARKLSGGEGFMIVFGRKGSDRYWWNLGGWGNAQHGLEFNQNPVGRNARGRIEDNRWYDVKIELAGDRIRCSLDGQLVHDATVQRTEEFFVTTGRDEGTGDLIVKAINVSAEPVSAKLGIAGVQKLAPKAAVTTLASADLGDNNTLDEPFKVVPKTSEIDVNGPDHTFRFQPHSFTLIRFRARDGRPPIVKIDPPEKEFFAKSLDFKGVPIKAPQEVEDEALQVAYDRLQRQMAHLPNVPINLAAAGAELHIIGRDQVTTDLPEWRQDKGKPIKEYNGLTRDQRTRGMGGLLTSCGEENLLLLPGDRYRGRDICVHEFAHNILDHGVPREIRQMFEAQRQRSLANGRWVRSYAGSNTHEFFAELTMWYFGTRGDLSMQGPKPEPGPEGLRKYDPEAFALFDAFYSGRIDVPIIDRSQRGQRRGGNAKAPESGANLAVVAKSSTSFVSGHETINALNDGFDPAHANDKSHGAYGNWPQTGTQWVQYEWSESIHTDKIDVYWFDDGGGVRLPKACRLLYWDGANFVPVNTASGLGLAGGRYNTTSFAAVSTAKLRLEFDANDKASTGVLEWRVYDSGKSPNFAPIVDAGIDRVVVMPGATYLTGTVRDDGKMVSAPPTIWYKESGPGLVTFTAVDDDVMAATFSQVGDYVLKLMTDDGLLDTSDAVRVTVVAEPPAAHLEPVVTRTYRINSPLWSQRAKALIVNWIPHCIDRINDPNLVSGGIINFVEAGNKLAGRPHHGLRGAVFAATAPLNIVESICVALAVDPQGDQRIIRAQQLMQATLDDWIPKILGAQEPDGYFQPAYTLDGSRRWSPGGRGGHEGYIAGYFIEAGIAHYEMTNRTNARFYHAAKKLADCWCANIGPAPKKPWYDGHQEMEMALVRLGRLVNEVDGRGTGDKYIALAKFLLDCRRDGSEYDQSHLPVTRQYEAVGHAVRAVYCYAGMADVAMEMRDVDYQSAVMSLWNSIVNRKYYVTGGIGSGESSEGFGPDYSLRNNAYCESCSSCGAIFFQHKLNLMYHDARYADLYEETLYNALLGSVDLDGKNFYYQNPLDGGGARYAWHDCPCCVGNIPRVLLALPTWMYATDVDGVYINLFIGSTVTVPPFGEIVQTTNYPWSGASIAVNPTTTRTFSIRIRVPNRTVSRLYTSTPNADGISAITVNGTPITPKVENGYAVIRREWKTGDTINVELPRVIQRVKAAGKIAADMGRVALRYGPLVYNIERVDQDISQALSPAAELTTEWRPELLGGVMVIKGTFANGAPMRAIPNYARNNRDANGRGGSIVWIKDQ